MEDPSLQGQTNAIYSLNLCYARTPPPTKLNIILTLLLGFVIVTTSANETGGSLSKKEKGSATSSLQQLQPRAKWGLKFLCVMVQGIHDSHWSVSNLFGPY